MFGRIPIITRSHRDDAVERLASRHVASLWPVIEPVTPDLTRKPLGRNDDPFNCVEIELKVVFSFVPIPFTTAITASEMPAAIRPYSIAVAAKSSCRNETIFGNMPDVGRAILHDE